MPALEALVDRFEKEANTQLVGISVDSPHSHGNWAWDLGGVSYPLLADFHPRGAVADKFGLYLADRGTTDRATVIVDVHGVVRYAHSVTPAGRRDAGELLAIARDVNARHGQGASGASPVGERPRLAPDATLFVREGCRFCAAVLRAAANLHCVERLRVRDVTRDPAAARDLAALTGGETRVPALVQGPRVQHESAEIIKTLAAAYERC